MARYPQLTVTPRNSLSCRGCRGEHPERSAKRSNRWCEVVDEPLRTSLEGITGAASLTSGARGGAEATTSLDPTCAAGPGPGHVVRKRAGLGQGQPGGDSGRAQAAADLGRGSRLETQPIALKSGIGPIYVDVDGGGHGRRINYRLGPSTRLRVHGSRPLGFEAASWFIQPSSSHSHLAYRQSAGRPSHLPPLTHRSSLKPHGRAVVPRSDPRPDSLLAATPG